MTRTICGTCIYWDEDTDYSKFGYCRRLSPRISRPKGDDRVGQWPLTRPTDWCGEGERIPVDYDIPEQAKPKRREVPKHSNPAGSGPPEWWDSTSDQGINCQLTLDGGEVVVGEAYCEGKRMVFKVNGNWMITGVDAWAPL